jgi:hypothetical protein
MTRKMYQSHKRAKDNASPNARAASIYHCAHTATTHRLYFEASNRSSIASTPCVL